MPTPNAPFWRWDAADIARAARLGRVSAREVAEAYGRLEATGRELGSPLASPFGQLAFLALSVIPEARVTDRGFLHVGP